MRVGVYGGSFDPIHYGHLAAAEEVRHSLDLGQVLFVPARHQPLKSEAPRADEAQRRLMVEAALGPDPHAQVCSLELERPAPSYTVDTVRELRAMRPADDLYLLLGVDAVETLQGWREAAALVAEVRLVIMSRGEQREPRWSRLGPLERLVRSRAIHVQVPNIGTGSRDLRERIRDGRPIRYQVPESVCTIIEERGLYR